MNLLRKDIKRENVIIGDFISFLVFEELKKQEMDFMEFVYTKSGEYTLKYEEHIDAVDKLFFEIIYRNSMKVFLLWRQFWKTSKPSQLKRELR
jgi:hypothetical protein